MVDTRRLSHLVEQAAVSFPPGPLLIALSGGADSAVVAWLASRAGSSVRAVHVHHGLSGSDIMEKAAGEVAGAIGVPIATRYVHVERDSEGEARTARYGALFDERREEEWLVTGHTADDQAETVMINLLRSAGLEGLAGMSESRWPIARPMLGVWRAQTREIAGLAGLPFQDDPANQEPRHLRNRIRLSLLPEIEGSFNPSFRESLVRTAATVRSDTALIERMSASLRVERTEGALRFLTGELAAADPAVAARVVRKALAAARPPHPPSYADVGVVLSVVTGQVSSGTVAGGGRVERRGPWVEVEWSAAPGSAGPVVLACPGITRNGRFQFTVTTAGNRPVRPLSLWALVVEDGAPLTVEGVSAGLTMDGRSVESLLSGARIGGSRRSTWPVVRRGGEVVWIPGVRRVGWPPAGEARYLCVLATEENGWARFEP